VGANHEFAPQVGRDAWNPDLGASFHIGFSSSAAVKIGIATTAPFAEGETVRFHGQKIKAPCRQASKIVADPARIDQRRIQP
jgi:hypothetical protein